MFTVNVNEKLQNISVKHPPHPPLLVRQNIRSTTSGFLSVIISDVTDITVQVFYSWGEGKTVGWANEQKCHLRQLLHNSVLFLPKLNVIGLELGSGGKSHLFPLTPNQYTQDAKKPL